MDMKKLKENRRPYASDWILISEGTYHSSESNLYWSTRVNPKGCIYDERSANHNGIIGMGLDLRRIIQNER